MLSRAARCVTSHGLVIRALAECDSEAVARFNGNANSSQMKKIINDSNFCGVICENKDKQPVVLSTGRAVDDGRTLVSNVRYRNPSFAGDSSGVEEKTRLFCISEARKSLPSLERVAFTASSLDAYQPALRNGESPYRLVCERTSTEINVDLNRNGHGFDSNMRTLPVKEFGDAEARDFMTRVIYNKDLFPRQRIIVNGDQYRLLAANVDDIVRHTDLITASFGNGKLGRCSGLAFGTVSWINGNEICYTLDYHGDHTNEAKDHVITHVNSLKGRHSENMTCCIRFNSSSSSVDVVSVKCRFNPDGSKTRVNSEFTLEVPFIGFLSKENIL